MLCLWREKKTSVKIKFRPTSKNSVHLWITFQHQIFPASPTRFRFLPLWNMGIQANDSWCFGADVVTTRTCNSQPDVSFLIHNVYLSLFFYSHNKNIIHACGPCKGCSINCYSLVLLCMQKYAKTRQVFHYCTLYWSLSFLSFIAYLQQQTTT